MTIVLSTLAIVSPWLPFRMSCSSWVRIILWGLSGSCSFRPASEPVPVRLSEMGLPSESIPNWSQCTKSYAPGSSWVVGSATLKPFELPLDDCVGCWQLEQCAASAIHPALMVHAQLTVTTAAAGMILITNSLRFMMYLFGPCGRSALLLPGPSPRQRDGRAVHGFCGCCRSGRRLTRCSSQRRSGRIGRSGRWPCHQSGWPPNSPHPRAG